MSARADLVEAFVGARRQSLLCIGRRRFLQWGMLAAAFPLGGCAPNGALKVAIQPWCGYQFLMLARQRGWLPAQGLDVQATRQTQESVAALKAGRVDGAALTLDEVLRLRDGGMSIKIVLIFDVSAGADVVLAKPAVRRFEDLKGKRIGVEHSSLGLIMLSKLLEVAGLKRGEVEVVEMGDDHVKAWDTNDMDAVITYEPSLSPLQAKGLSILFDSRRLPQMIVDVLAIRSEALERHAAALRALIAGHFRALGQWQVNPVDSSYHLAPLLGVAPEKVRDIYRGLDLPDAPYNREYLSPPATDLKRSARDIAAIMTDAGLLTRPLDLDGLFSADYLPVGRP